MLNEISEIKSSDGKVSTVEIWGMWSMPSLPLLPGQPRPKVFAHDRVVSMG